MTYMKNGVASQLVELIGFDYFERIKARSLETDRHGLHYSHNNGTQDLFTRVLRDGVDENHVLVYEHLPGPALRMRHCIERLPDCELVAALAGANGL